MASNGAGYRGGIIEKRGFSLNRCLCIFWIIVIFVGRESQQSSVIIVQDERCDPCYRKLLVGKRLTENHVMRSIRCERIEECHRTCEYESTFVCEGFNYGRMQHDKSNRYDVHREGDPGGYNMCQLTSMSGARMDPHRDFLDDSRYDYYERDWRCPAEKSHGEFGRHDWPNQPPSRRPLPSWHQQSALPSSQSSNNHHRLPNEIPTLNYLRPYQPDRGVRLPVTTRYYGQEKVRPSVENNPNGYYGYTHGYLPQQRPYNDISYNRPHQIAPKYLPNDYRHTATGPPANYGQYPFYSNRRVGEATNEILPGDYGQKPADYNGDWPISRVYGPSYGYQTNRYPGKWLAPKLPSRKPSHEHHYGNHDYTYGPAYGYNGQQPIGSYIRNWKTPNRQKWIDSGGTKDCSVRSATGFKITRKIAIASYVTANLEECEMLCSTRADCLSFAYRYSLAATAPTDNCLLSSINFEKLDLYTDLEPDRDYDIYAIIGDPRNCQPSDKNPMNSELRPHRRPSEECFWRVRNGFGMPPNLTKKQLRVDNGLGECQIACISARRFTCRSFVFRYVSEEDREANCFLSDCPTNEIISASGGSRSQDRQAELYERGSYGRGCEAYPFARIYNSAKFGKSHRGDEGCYSGYDGGCKLSPYAVSSMTRADSENECRRKCSRMRYSQQTPCMSFSFKLGDEKHGDNCYLSDVPRRDLRPGLDYTYDDDYVMYAWKDLEPQCASFPGTSGYQQNGGFHGNYDNPSTNTDTYLPDDVSRPPPLLGPGTGLISYNNLFLAVRPLDPDRPDPVSPPDYPSSSTPHQNDDSGYPSRPGSSSYPDGFGSFNRHYTVNGYPCKRGTKCEKNLIVGFWSCEPEGEEFGSWDYCCEPNHHCGFSEGYRYPWCYVGPSEDQWRPCSDKYYPYLPSPRPAMRPQTNNDYRRPNGQDFSYHRHNDDRYRGNEQKSFDNEDSTFYHGRHWPIAFLHPIPPPNCSTDSIALANDRRDDRREDTKNRTSETDRTTSKSEITQSPLKNSSITRLQLHKSHLKRRGLVSNSNRTRNDPITSYEGKIHRISIIPAITMESREEKMTQGQLSDYAKFNDTEDNYTSNYDDSTKFRKNNLTTMNINDFDDFHAENGNFTKKRNKIGFGRIERVTKATEFEDNNKREGN